MWKTPQKASTPILFLIAGICMIGAAVLRPDEGWVTWVWVLAGSLMMINAMLQMVLRRREQRERDGGTDSAP